MRLVVRLLAVLALVLLGAAAYVGVNIARVSGFFGPLESALVEDCLGVDTPPGPEDIVVDPATGLAYISASDRRALAAGEPPKGGVYVLDPARPSSLRLASIDAPADFQPHGIDLWEDSRGGRRLFVVSHPTDGRHVVEIFDVREDGALAHAETISFSAMTSPNDVAAVGPRAFYVSNDHGFDGAAMRALEDFGALPASYVAYFDGERGRIAAKGLRYANGVRTSEEGGVLYVAETLGRGVRAYGRDAATGELTQTRRFPLSTNPDNIEIDAAGALWIGAQPRPLAFLAHSQDSARTAPAEIIRLDPETGEHETVFMALEGEISATATGAVHDGRLLVSAVLDPRILICPLAEAG